MGGTPMFGMLAIFGDLGCIVGPELTAVVSSVKGMELRHGIFAAAIFPLVIFVLCFVLFIADKRKKRNNTKQ